MTIPIRQSTASQEVPIGPFLDSTDGNTQETGLTIANTDVKLWKAGATSLVNKNSGGGTHMAGGVYSMVLDATDSATLGPMVAYVHVAGALAFRLEMLVLAANVYDSLVAASDTLDVQVTGIAAAAITATSIAGDAITDAKVASDVTIASVTGNVGGNVVGSVGSVAAGGITASSIAADAIGASELAADAAAEIAAAVWADTSTEPVVVPVAGATRGSQLAYLVMKFRNRLTQTASVGTTYQDDGTTVFSTQAVDVTAGTFTRSEEVTA
jgi:hypothetical protein